MLRCTEEPMQLGTCTVVAHAANVLPRRIGLRDLVLKPLDDKHVRNALKDPVTYVQNAPQRLVGSNVLAALLRRREGLPRHLCATDGKKIVALGTLYRNEDGKLTFGCIVENRTYSYFWSDEGPTDGMVLCLRRELPLPD
jgi:hypothetical protein